MSVLEVFELKLTFFLARWSCSLSMMSFWECASSGLMSNHHATRAFAPSESPDLLQRPTFRHLTLVSTENSWLFTASASLRSGWCGTSCMILNLAATTEPARHPGLLSGGGRWDRLQKRRQTMERNRCLSRISHFLHVLVGSARALETTKWA